MHPMTSPAITDPLEVTRSKAAVLTFHPRGTHRCVGAPVFRSQLARDLACLLDLDPPVREWSCLPITLGWSDTVHVPDFMVVRGKGATLVDAVEGVDAPLAGWIEAEAVRLGYAYERVGADEIEAGARLANARDLLRYASWQCPLGDRVRLLAALDENGQLTISECLPAFRETVPIAGLSSLILHRFVEVELDDARISPETPVRRCRV
jgi:hypothetical protein